MYAPQEALISAYSKPEIDVMFELIDQIKVLDWHVCGSPRQHTPGSSRMPFIQSRLQVLTPKKPARFKKSSDVRAELARREARK